MPQIILTQEQADLAAKSLEPVQLCDPVGNIIASIAPVWTMEDIAEAKRALASPGPWYTGAQVQARLRALQEEWDRVGGFDKAYMRDFLDRLDSVDPGQIRPRLKTK